MIALHAALLAHEVPQAGADDLRPPRGHQRDHQATPRGRPLPIGRLRDGRAGGAGHRGDHGRRRVLHADPGRAVAAASCMPAGRIGARTSGSRAGRWRRTPRPTAPSAASARRRPSSRRRCRSTASRRRSSQSPLDLRRRWVYREGDTTPTGQVLRESVGGQEVLERAAEAAAFDRTRGADARLRARAAPTARASASGIGLALAWHGAGFTGSGEVKLASVASASS